MKLFPLIASVLLVLVLTASLLAFQGNVFEDDEETPPLPADAHQNAEWAFARYHFRNGDSYGGFRRFELWRADYPKADRQFTMGVRRLTRLHARGVEQIVDADSEDYFGVRREEIGKCVSRRWNRPQSKYEWQETACELHTLL